MNTTNQNRARAQRRRRAIDSATTQPAKPWSYRDSIMKPGAARIALYGDCSPFLGGTPDECCIFVNVVAALEHVELLRGQNYSSVIREWEIQMLRGDGLWQGCVAAGTFEKLTTM